MWQQRIHHREIAPDELGGLEIGTGHAAPPYRLGLPADGIVGDGLLAQDGVEVLQGTSHPNR